MLRGWLPSPFAVVMHSPKYDPWCRFDWRRSTIIARFPVDKRLTLAGEEKRRQQWRAHGLGKRKEHGKTCKFKGNTSYFPLSIVYLWDKIDLLIAQNSNANKRGKMKCQQMSYEATIQMTSVFDVLRTRTVVCLVRNGRIGKGSAVRIWPVRRRSRFIWKSQVKR